MRVPLVAANWKMHGSKRFVSDYFARLNKCLDVNLSEKFTAGKFVDKLEIAVFPPFVYLQSAVDLATQAGVLIGGQNLNAASDGAYTGETAAEMLKDVGCRMVLVGHSERRSLYGETNEQVANKFKAACESGLIPVLCVGETLTQREQGNTQQVVSDQLQSVINIAGLASVTASVIAYEPVWAIGTGLTATPEQAQEVHRAIRGLLGEPGQTTRILYGGSVKAANAEALFAQPDIDGGLVGGASLDAEEFSAICEKALSS